MIPLSSLTFPDHGSDFMVIQSARTSTTFGRVQLFDIFHTCTYEYLRRNELCNVYFNDNTLASTQSQIFQHPSTIYDAN